MSASFNLMEKGKRHTYNSHTVKGCQCAIAKIDHFKGQIHFFSNDSNT